MRHRLAHRVGRSSQATTAAVDKSPRRLTHENPDAPGARPSNRNLDDLPRAYDDRPGTSAPLTHEENRHGYQGN